MHLTKDEARLVAVRRAIEKFKNPGLLGVLEASAVAEYITNLIDIESIEDIADEQQIEYFLDGLILGIVVSRLLEANIDLESLPKNQEDAKKQFQTGVDVEGNVRVNT